MSRLVMVAFIAVALLSDIARAEDELEADPLTCRGLSVSLFERRFPDKVKRLTFKELQLNKGFIWETRKILITGMKSLNQFSIIRKSYSKLSENLNHYPVDQKKR